MNRQPCADPKPIRVFVVDRDERVRDALRAIIANEPDLQMVGEAATGEEAVAAVAGLDPDVLLMESRAAAEIGGTRFPGDRRRSPDSPRLVLLTNGVDLDADRRDATAQAVFKGCDFESLREFVETPGDSRPKEASAQRTQFRTGKG